MRLLRSPLTRRSATVLLSLSLMVGATAGPAVVAETDPTAQLGPDTTLTAIPVVVIHPTSAQVRKKKSVDLQAFICLTFPPRLKGETIDPDSFAALRFPEGPDGVPAKGGDDFCRETEVERWEVVKPKIAKTKGMPGGKARAIGKKEGQTVIIAAVSREDSGGVQLAPGRMTLSVIDKPSNYTATSRSSHGDDVELNLLPGDQFTVTGLMCKGRICLNGRISEVGFDAETIIRELGGNRGTRAFAVDPLTVPGEARFEVLRMQTPGARPIILSVHIAPEHDDDPPVVQAKYADWNDDGEVDARDAEFIIFDHGEAGPKARDLDLNGDDKIDIWDFLMLQQLIEADGNPRYSLEDFTAYDGDFFSRQGDFELESEQPTLEFEEEEEPLPGLEDDEPSGDGDGGDATSGESADDAASDDDFELEPEDSDLPGLEDDDGAGVGQAPTWDETRGWETSVPVPAELAKSQAAFDLVARTLDYVVSATLDDYEGFELPADAEHAAAMELRGTLDGLTAEEKYRAAVAFASWNAPEPGDDRPARGVFHPDLDANGDGVVDTADAEAFGLDLDGAPGDAFREQVTRETDEVIDLVLLPAPPDEDDATPDGE